MGLPSFFKMYATSRNIVHRSNAGTSHWEQPAAQLPYDTKLSASYKTQKTLFGPQKEYGVGLHPMDQAKINTLTPDFPDWDTF